ncbi:MAG: ribonuclease H-like domain-containing protein [Planctomycetota bacterium]|nr:ribonuclease H-like domain-containing protein [Planctomycetota bacterium]
MTQQQTIAFDIEVAGFPWEEVDEITRGYLLSRAKAEADREAVPERTGLFPGLGKIVAIGMWLVREDRGMILLEGKASEEHDWEKVPNSKIFRGDERAVLEKFWEKVGRLPKSGSMPRLVSYNGRTYDGPMLTIRSAQLGVKPSRNLIPKRWEIADHCDLMDVFNFQGTVRDSYSLEYWCRRFDVESPKGSIDGSQVARVYRQGRIEDIGEYCLRDVRATSQLFQRLETTILPVMQGR